MGQCNSHGISVRVAVIEYISMGKMVVPIYTELKEIVTGSR